MADFDSVPFKDCRPRLKAVLVSVGLLATDVDVDALMRAMERRFAWGSVVRCSLSGWNKKYLKYTAATTDVLPAFKHPEAGAFLRTCMRRFLSRLPTSIRAVVLLGNDDKYIKIIGRELHAIYGSGYSRTNEVTHSTGSLAWVHVGHPSPLNGHYKNFIEGDVASKQGRKRERAKETLMDVVGRL